jgi:hypothetical protein
VHQPELFPTTALVVQEEAGTQPLVHIIINITSRLLVGAAPLKT